ncbi:poly-gamma-glutamate synthesis protein (capsule biosynthesis protein) [Fontibacillus panacisegetis]|uniref:Poly-gamma-glutamate synthesis protein (Capsule biosynthesis protein) n=1 Tax=Fontibacillus panacisegetis TaxID=670482 RepID=A0A1G7MS05_9BACL|nr:CapA family protein [Fontibacillus panacisegetis]SDF64451.1 poly-gamma-glutamate synthesis protein (capsule biosynthesis protein) [Fontibacillus panacisegetis]
MYPPRSEKNKQKKKERQRVVSRFWMMLNLSLIMIILVLGVYFVLEDRSVKGNSDNTEIPDSSFVSDPQTDDSDTADVDRIDEADNPLDQEQDSSAPSGQIGEETVDGEDSSQGEAAPPEHNGEEAEQELLIHFGGDTIFSDKVAVKLNEEGYDYPYEYVRELFQNDDLTVVNLETPVTERGVGAENKTFVFKSSPKALPEMVKAGIDAVNLANNHSLDQGVEGLLDTIDHLKDNHILHVGAGKNRNDAFTPIYVERKGIKIAICGFSRVIPHESWSAEKKRAGVAATYNSEMAVKAIQAARKNADLVLVVVHWGKERATELEKHQTSLAHEYIDAGADLVIGGHPHVLQGIEKYKNKWIAYSSGNFIFTKSKDPKTWDTAVFSAKCTKKGDCDLSLIPYRTELGRPVPVSEEDGAGILKMVEGLSPGIKIDASGNVKTEN